MYGKSETQAQLNEAHAACQKLLNQQAAYHYGRRRVPRALSIQIEGAQSRIRMLELHRERLIQQERAAR